MISLYLVKIINMIALIFVPLNLLYSPEDIGSNGLIFVWLCAAAFITNALRRRKSRLFFLPAACIFLPLLLAKTLDDYIYLGAFSVIACYLGIWGIKGVNYDMEYEIFRRGIVLCAGTFVVSVITSSVGLFNRYSAQHVIIFLVSSVLLMRTLRYVQYNSDSREARKINNRYSVVIIILSSILSISYVREIVVNSIKYLYTFITEGFMWLFSWLFLGIGYLLVIAQKAVAILIARINKEWPQLFQNVNPPKDVEIPKVEEVRNALFDNLLFNVMLKIVIICIIIYIIVRILRYFTAKSRDDGQYYEEREFITKSTVEGRNSLKKLFDFLKPKNNSEHIRLYYQKYMKMCIDKDLGIQGPDTTQDINDKAQKVFSRSLIDEIRNIYIKIRYGNKEATREMVKKMGEHYGNLKK